jgi:hypothetical protein
MMISKAILLAHWKEFVVVVIMLLLLRYVRKKTVKVLAVGVGLYFIITYLLPILDKLLLQLV